MTDPLTLDPQRTAVLCMDYQASIVARFAGDADAMLKRAASVLAAAREARAMVGYVVVGFRPGFPEVSPRNKSFSAIQQSAALFAGDGGRIHPVVAPRDGDIVVTKHRVSAFAGTDLEMLLRARDIDTLLLFGIATSGVVLSTVRHAADADYRLVVVSDCCADAAADVHACLVEKVFPRQATVVTAAEALQALGARV
ncbi:MAG TPA: isochorismatase family cysteine hydrolase [Myxococcales bacterium]|nr:isochorismatase family cysteine hydrolase [Myxococcales bacterium]